MATIRHDIAIDAPPQHIWDVLRDIGAVHERLLPGRVANAPPKSGSVSNTAPRR
ncbi:hypothetical protein [Nocardia sp. MDA0666]|uniref:hypothetical protein n=1 Tax=Nocardia sp. MDA0666 TaxID=2135448 RepID=UPI0018EAB728|nr:hypothetical protein [Nocardia sp. MDA0666]